MEKITIFSVVGGLILSGLTILSNVWITYINNRANRKKEMHLKMLELAFKEYELRTNVAIKEAEKRGAKALLYPFDLFLIFYTKLAEKIEKGKLTGEDIKSMRSELDNIGRAYGRGE